MLQNMHLAYEVIVHGFAKIFDTISEAAKYADEQTALGYDIFAFRETDPNVMKAHPEPVGEENDHYLSLIAHEVDMVVAAWGTHGAHRNRGQQVKQLIKDLHCLKITKGGHPSHPLYLRASLVPIEFNAA